MPLCLYDCFGGYIISLGRVWIRFCLLGGVYNLDELIKQCELLRFLVIEPELINGIISQ